MPHIMTRFRVQDYDRWKARFDQHRAVREQYGSCGGAVFRSATDPNEVTVLLEWTTYEQAEAFAQSADLREAQRQAGVITQPEVWVLDQTDQPSV